MGGTYPGVQITVSRAKTARVVPINVADPSETLKAFWVTVVGMYLQMG